MFDSSSIEKIILSRRSIRAFQKKALPEKFAEEVIGMAIWAPNSGNSQAWKYYIIKNDKIKKELSSAAYGQPFVADAPLVIVVVAMLDIANKYYRSRGTDLYCIQDTAAAVQNMLLYAASKGIGTCWVGAFEEKQVASTLKCPNSERPVAIIPFGYPNESPKAPKRKTVEQVSQVIE